MSHCAIKEFLEGSNDLIVTLHDTRYGGSFIAAVTHLSKVEDTIDTFECTNGESDWELWGMSNGWYPWGAGRTINNALDNLRHKLQVNRGNWDDIRFGLVQVSQYAPHISKRITSMVVTMEQLVQVRKEWNDGSGPARFF